MAVQESRVSPRPCGIRNPRLGSETSSLLSRRSSLDTVVFQITVVGGISKNGRHASAVHLPGRRAWCAASPCTEVQAARGVKTKNYGYGQFKSPIRERIEMSHNSGTGGIKSPVMERIEMSRNTSAFCDVPPNPSAASTSCQRKRDSMRCTANCMTGFHGFPIAKECVSLNVSMGGRCYGNNRCVCSNQYRGDYCQYPITLCDGHTLGAGGSSWHCNHTHVETICQVSCPAGLEFQAPGAAPVYRCSLTGVWDPPFVPPCVPGSSRANTSAHGDLNQGQQTVTEGSEHDGQQQLDLGGHVTEVTTKKNLVSDSLTDKGSDLPPEEIPGENELPPASTGVCSTWGRFQFKSFDGTLFRFAGTCRYVLLKDCAQPDPSAKFSVELQALRRAAPTRPTALERCTSLVQEPHAGKYLVLQSPQGYTVWIDEESVQIRVTPALRETACGLCGHFDGEPSNDLTLLDARSALTPREFGISWVVERDCVHSGLEREACAGLPQGIETKPFLRVLSTGLLRQAFALRAASAPPWMSTSANANASASTSRKRGEETQSAPTRVTEVVNTTSAVRLVVPRAPTASRHARSANAPRAATVPKDCSGTAAAAWSRDSAPAPTGAGSTRAASRSTKTAIHVCVTTAAGSAPRPFVTQHARCFWDTSTPPLTADGFRRAVIAGSSCYRRKASGFSSNARELTSLPAVLPNVTITKPTSFFIEVETKGLTLLTDGKSRLVLTANEGLYTKTMGMCGTFNHNSQDDFLCPGGDIDYQVESFAKQWADGECASVEAVATQCDQDTLLWPESKHICRQLYQGAFTVCHHSVNPDPFFELCIQASCGCHSGSGDCLCPVFSHYAHACSSKGHVIDWRAQVPVCGVYCEHGQTYQSCAPVCDSSCALIGRNTSCGGRCVEGCACDPGFSLDRRGRCVPISQCGCLFAGHEYPAGFKQRRHDQHCECLAGQWQCRPASADEVILVPPASECGTNEEYTECRSNCPATCALLHSPPAAGSCAVDVCQAGCQCRKGFVRDERTGSCVPPTSCPCQHGLRSYADGDKIDIECNQCTCERGRWLCTQHECAGTCALWGDSHVRTFDGLSFDFRGTCDYVLAKGRLSGNETVSVVVQNVPCGSKSSCAKTVTVIAGSEEPLVLTEGHPVPPVSDDSAMSVRSIGLFVAVYVRGSLSVYWDKHTRVYVVAGPVWAGKLSGLCGNFNGDGTDEFRSPSGGPALPQAEEFVDSWRLHSYCAPALPAQHGCLQRPERREWAASRCAALKEQPFRECHSEVDVQPFHDRCVSDTCSCDTGGDCECLCTALSAYAHECAQRGVRVLWRSQELCPVQCETCDEYSACVSGCEPPNCAHPASETNCPKAAPVCLEGCAPARCPTGEVHRNATDHRCVPFADCEIPPETGCNVGGESPTRKDRGSPRPIPVNRVTARKVKSSALGDRAPWS
ncbi:hypothetical protein MRX96_030205 [Rhipicephalus microplus]